MALSVRGKSNVDEFMPKIAAAVAQKTQKHRIPIIDLSTAENWLMRDELVALFKDILRERLCNDDLSYPNGFAGCPKLLQSLSSFFNDHFNPHLPVEPGHIVVGPGAAAILDSLIFNICNPGDGVLVMAPYWVGFDFALNVRPSVRVVQVDVPDPSEVFSPGITAYLVEALRTSDVPIKAMILCNPHNPLGQCYTRQALEECLRFCQKENLHFISDEIYALSVFDSPDVPSPEPFVSALSFDPAVVGCDMARVHTVWSSSKDFGSSGLRLGVLVTQDNPSLGLGVALAANTQVSSLTAVVFSSLFSQKPLLNELIATNRARLARAYSRVVGFLKFHKMRYSVTYAGLYVWVRLSHTVSTWEQEAELWKRLGDKRVAVSAGRGYHASEPGWFRITFSVAAEDLTQGLCRIEEALGLKGWMDFVATPEQCSQ
ncbi:pyridoxal phosphate-dependent transferase [Sphaerosporella brunnea]|uniref:Pyridoxal phosphate-dependent transferase n=1 Tax=Sphaerosporella brunnea TaxID=1250544 RepID=A0A5J5EJS3_9PEZI|nr:pyridoxal phosphate-dependent transferase [Sphaerosporella brunnea]